MRVYNIKVNGKKFKVEVMGVSEVATTKVETKEEAKPATPVAATAPAGGATVVSPMQGTILDVKVKVGDKIKVGQTIAILEAMKLENEVKSTVAGEVKEVKVSKGQQVNNKEVIIVVG